MKKNLLWFFGLALVAATTFTITSCGEDDPCKGVECGANGSCFDGACVCNEGYEGTNCDVKWNAKYLASSGAAGSYNTTETCTIPAGVVGAYSNTISAGADDTHLIVSNFGDSGQNVVITLTDATEVEVPATNVTFGANVTSVTATGTYASGVLTINYIGTVGGTTTINCTSVMTKI